MWDSIRSLDWLGYPIETVKFVLSKPAGRLKRLKKVLETGLEIISVVNIHKTVPFRKVASFVGQVISMYTVIGSVCQLMTRCINIGIRMLTPGMHIFDCQMRVSNKFDFGFTTFIVLMLEIYLCSLLVIK